MNEEVERVKTYGDYRPYADQVVANAAQQALAGDVNSGAAVARDAGHIARSVNALGSCASQMGQKLAMLERELDRLMGGHPEPAAGAGALAGSAPIQQRPCDVDALDNSVKQMFEHSERLGRLLDRLREL